MHWSQKVSRIPIKGWIIVFSVCKRNHFFQPFPVMMPMWLWRSLKILIVTVKLLCQRCRCWSSWRRSTLTEDGGSSLSWSSAFIASGLWPQRLSCSLNCASSPGLVCKFSTGLTTTATSVFPLSCSASAPTISLRRITSSHFQSNRSDTWHTRSSRQCDVSKGRAVSGCVSEQVFVC